MKKQVFHDATTGILIGLILAIIFSFIHSGLTLLSAYLGSDWDSL